MRQLLHNVGWRALFRPVLILASVGLTTVPGLIGNARAASTEPWADPRLPVRDELEAWYDAAVPTPPPWPFGRSPLTKWADASGNQHHLLALTATNTPVWRNDLVPGLSNAVIRFNGTNDYLSGRTASLRLTNCTIFIVAAPRSNRGSFRGLLAMHREGGNDYTTGLNIDFSWPWSARVDVVNVEGAGFPGAVDLLDRVFDFGTFHTYCLSSSPGLGATKLYVDGTFAGQRDRAPSVLNCDELLVGARFYSNTKSPPIANGFLDGDVAEILVFSRLLEGSERNAVEKYLTDKHLPLQRLKGIQVDQPEFLPTATNAPAVQMFVPGFTVRELPVQLSNINCVKYRPDGKLVALGYDGRIHLLSDRDHDGLEETVEPFWEGGGLRAPIGLALTPPNYPRGQGVFVPAKGKVALLVDTNGDDRADREIVVAQGWTELPHGVDALGVAVDSEGNCYFGLGAANFTNPYLVDATGRARVDLKNERGSVVRVSADFEHREIFTTGIRFPVAMAFNAAGDLFSTDQEGATWLANGNPLDELLHLQAGRHYGFPPRHPKHLPGVIDEPSVFDYAPQHQSTCGLCFNEPVRPGGPIFGPANWRGDALVCGYSRGKLYRTSLFKTAEGYVAQNHLIGCLNMLTVDACVSPQGDLVVAVQSGQPDWGSGPTGMGKLFKVSYSQTNGAQPLFAYPISPNQTEIVFDRPSSLSDLKGLKPIIVAGNYVAAGDRFESLRPGYQVVQDQLTTARNHIPVLAVHLSVDQRTVTLVTPPRQDALRYAITLPGLGRPARKDGRSGSLDQEPDIDLAHDLSGVELEWRSGSSNGSWWLPHLDLAVARAFTRGSQHHESLWSGLDQNGTLLWRTQLDLSQMLRPAVQPGATLDYELPAEKVTLTFSANQPITVRAATKPNKTVLSGEAGLPVTLKVSPVPGAWLPLEIEMACHGNDAELHVSWRAEEDPRPRALPLRRFFVPWAKPPTPHDPLSIRNIPEIASGNWLRGQQLFRSEQLGCAKCHRMRGQGGAIGPDLSNLVQRDYASVLKDIREPNAALNPDHISYRIQLKNGEELTGTVLSDSPERIILGVAAGTEMKVAKADIAASSPSTVSIMPEGLLDALTVQERTDLMAFLLTSPLDPAPIPEPSGMPPARRWADIQPLFTATAAINAADLKPLRILLVAGPKDHGPGEHDYPLWQKRWEKLLALGEKVTVSTAFGWPTTNQFANADLVVFYSNNPGWTAEKGPELDAFLRRGGGLAYLHFAVDGHQDSAALSERIGLAWVGGQSRFRHGPVELQFRPGHVLGSGYGPTTFTDESYWALLGDPARIDVLASAVEEGESRPLLWTRESGGGRIFVSILGHYTWTFDDPLFRLLLLRGMAWASHQPLDRFQPLALIGARITEY